MTTLDSEQIEGKMDTMDHFGENEGEEFEEMSCSTHHKEKEIVTIVISEKENKAIQNLKRYNDKLSNMIQLLSIERAKLIENERNSTSEIKAQFKYLMNEINDKQEQILRELNHETQHCQAQIDKTSKMLKQKKDVTTNMISSCNNMLRDNNMNKLDRKKQIISMAKEVINEPISSYRPNYIECRFKQQETIKVTFHFIIQITSYLFIYLMLFCVSFYQHFVPLIVMKDIQFQI